MQVNRMRYYLQNQRLCLLVLLCFIGLLPLAGCGSSKKTYDDAHLRGVRAVYEGTIVNVGKTRVAEDPSLVGPIVGGVAGGVVGSLVAGTTGAVVGATGGAILGGAADVDSRGFVATELTIELESGAIMLVVLGNDEYFLRGDPVRVLSLGENLVRIQHK